MIDIHLRTLCRRAAAGAAAVTVIACGMTTGSAGADTISPYAANGGGTVGPVWTQISTAAGGYIDFKFLLLGAVSGTCKLIAIPQDLVSADAARGIADNPSRVMVDVPVTLGYASGRLGPLPNGTYDLSAGTYCDGVDTSGAHHMGRLISTLPRDSSDHWVEVRATLDGGDPVSALPLPIPQAQPQGEAKTPKTLSETCNAFVEGLTGGYITDPVTGGIGIVSRYWCGLVGDQATRSEQWCRAIEDLMWGFIPFVNFQRLNHEFGNSETYCR